jgi:hypothetical protein
MCHSVALCTRHNRWVNFSALMPWVELEETNATQFNPTSGAPAKPVRVAFGTQFIKQRLGLTDEETVEQIRENPYMQFFLGFSGYSSKPPFDPSITQSCSIRAAVPRTPSASQSQSGGLKLVCSGCWALRVR